ncbi:hypothetical protein AKJ16_DCAP12164 [Drosera capensis]
MHCLLNSANFTTTAPIHPSHLRRHRSLQSPLSLSPLASFTHRTFSLRRRSLGFCRCSIAGASRDETLRRPPASSFERVVVDAADAGGDGGEGGAESDGGGEGESWSPSRIQVPRQSYIPVSKRDLLDALVLVLGRDSDDGGLVGRQFLLLSKCLDSILHAEHKSILEEMRADYSLYCSNKLDKRKSGGDHGKGGEVLGVAGLNGNGSVRSSSDEMVGSETQMPWSYDLRALGMPSGGKQGKSIEGSRVDVDLAEDVAQERRMRRGYVTEKEKGLLIGEKLDYLQSKLLQGAFSIVSKPLRILGLWINQALESGRQKSKIQVWLNRVKLWLEEESSGLHSYKDQASNVADNLDHEFDADLPIWVAAQRAASRYEGLLSSLGPRRRLLRKFLTWMGLIQSMPEMPLELGDDNTPAVEPYLRPVSISRITLTDIWRPATGKYCGNDIWKMLRTTISIIFSRSVLQEPAFDQLILLTKETSEDETGDSSEIPSLQLRIFEKIPIPDLPVIFPNKKLSFRILDTVRLDIATIVGLLAYFINYKFEDVLASLSAVLLDAVAATALLIYIARVALGYKQTWDRYQLLVNKTLYTKTLASGFGSVHFLLDASEQQQYKECILAYAMLLNAEKGQQVTREYFKLQAINRSILGEKCERFLYDVFKEQIVMPINKAVETLKKFGLITEEVSEGKHALLAVPFSTAYNDLKQKWDCLLGWVFSKGKPQLTTYQTANKNPALNPSSASPPTKSTTNANSRPKLPHLRRDQLGGRNLLINPRAPPPNSTPQTTPSSPDNDPSISSQTGSDMNPETEATPNPESEFETPTQGEEDGEGVGEGEEDEEGGECGFCIYMKAGGCRESFVDWEKCMESAEKNEEDIVEKCHEITAKLHRCMEANYEYYAPLLKAEKEAEEKVAKEVEAERERERERAGENVEGLKNREESTGENVAG